MIEKFENDHDVHFRQVHRMIDLFETIIKTHTTFLLANYFQAKEVADRVAKVLAYGMQTPALGIWLRFNEVVLEELAYNHIPRDVYEAIYQLQSDQNKEKMDSIYVADGDEFIFRSTEELDKVDKRMSFLTKLFANYKRNHNQSQKPFTKLALSSFYTDFRKWHLDMSNKIVHFRNNYAHGATPSEDECRRDIERYLPELKKSLALPWLHETSVIVLNDDLQTFAVGSEWNDIHKIKAEILEAHVPYLVLPDQSVLQLFPTVTFQPVGLNNMQSISFFNDLKKFNNKKISYLNYPFAKHIQDDTVFSHFIEIFRIEEWRKHNLDEYEDLQLRLQENFKGRIKELDFLEEFVKRNSRGFLYLYGIPGIGKSALIANAFTEPNEQYDVIKGFIRKRKYTHVNEVLDYINRQLDSLYNLQYPYGNTEEEKRKLLEQRLIDASRSLVANHKKLIIMIDGLDEGDQSLLNHLIYETFEHVLIIYTSRETPAVTRFVNDLPLDYLTKKQLGKISRADIRALLYEVVDKYAITEEYVQLIAQKSGGHPLYIKLLCEALAQYPEKLNDNNYLPEKWEDFYKRFIDRFIDDERGQDIMDGLFVFAAAKDFLSQDHMRLILRNSSRQNLIIFDSLSELLIESLQYKKHYQLFHETFYEYLSKYHAIDLMDAEQKIIDFCLQWETLNRFDPSIIRYPLNHLATHLKDANRLEELTNLVHHETFIDKQIEETGQYDASFTLLTAYRTLAINKNSKEAVIDAMIELLRLNERLRKNYFSLQTSLKDSSMTDVELKLKNIRFYREKEQATIIFLDLWECVASKDVKVELMINKIDQFLEANKTFNWAEYIPLPLLVKLSIAISEMGLDASFIKRRVNVKYNDMKQVIEHFPLTEGNVITITLFIDQILSKENANWLELMVAFIKALFKNDLTNIVKLYEKKILTKLQTFHYNVFYEKYLIDIAINYLEVGWTDDAFNVVAKITNNSTKEKAYRLIYEQFINEDEPIANRAYSLGIDLLEQIDGENRLETLIKWLPIVANERSTQLYDEFKSEIENANDEEIYHLQFNGLQDLALYYWTNHDANRTFEIIDRIYLEESRYHALFNVLSTVPLSARNGNIDEEMQHLENQPDEISNKLDEAWRDLERYLLTRNVSDMDFYEAEYIYMIRRWFSSGNEEKVDNFIARLRNDRLRETLSIQLFRLKLPLMNQASIVQSASDLTSELNSIHAQKELVDVLIQYQSEHVLVQYIKAVQLMRNITYKEALITYLVTKALEDGKSLIPQKIDMNALSPFCREQINYVQINQYAIELLWEEAIQLLKHPPEKVLLSEKVINRVHIAIVQRLVNSGEREAGYALLDSLPDVESPGMIAERAINHQLLRRNTTEGLKNFERIFSTLFDYNDIDMKYFDKRDMLMSIVIQMGELGNEEVIDVLSKFYDLLHLDPDSLYPHLVVINLLQTQGLDHYVGEIVKLCEQILASQPIENVIDSLHINQTLVMHLDLANYYFMNGYPLRAKQLLREMIQYFQVERPFDQTTLIKSYLRLAYECRRQGFHEEADYFTDKYKQLYEPIYKETIWTEMISLYLRDDKIEEAIDALEKTFDYRGGNYLRIITHLLLEKEFDRALEVNERLQVDDYPNVNEDKIAGIKLIVNYLFMNHRESAAFETIQSVQGPRERFELYMALLPAITNKHIDVMLHYVSLEPFDLKRRLEEELLIYAITEPTFTTKELMKIIATLSVNQPLTALALYVLQVFGEREFDMTIDKHLLNRIQNELQQVTL